MHLQDLNHLRDDKRIRFSEETVNGETVTIVSYMVADPDLWKIPFATECRGSVFNSEGACISRPFHKFFNIGENEATQLQHIQGKTLEVLEKRDGSMLVPVLVGGEIACFIDDKPDFKSIALGYKDHKLFGLIMAQCRGKEPDYKKYWVQNMRDQYSLKCLYSNF